MFIMRTHFYKRKQVVSVFGLVMILLLVVLAACGNSDSNTATGSKSTNAGSAPTTNQPTPTPTSIAGYGTTQGCPSDAVVSIALKANQSVTVKSPTGTMVSANKGDIIELRFPFGKKWVGPTNVPSQLTMQQPAGYAEKSDNTCVWRFTAMNTGTVVLHFSSRAICKAGQMCPMYVVDVPVTVTVK